MMQQGQVMMQQTNLEECSSWMTRHLGTRCER